MTLAGQGDSHLAIELRGSSGDVGSSRYSVRAVVVAVGSTTTFVPMGTWS
jgi:hypothetical protein